MNYLLSVSLTGHINDKRLLHFAFLFFISDYFDVWLHQNSRLASPKTPTLIHHAVAAHRFCWHTGRLCLQVGADGLVVVGTEHGRLNGRFSTNKLAVCSAAFLRIEDVPDVEPMPLREVARLTSGGSGQGLFRCVCRKGCTGRCKCVRAARKCISRCHKGAHCGNK